MKRKVILSLIILLFAAIAIFSGYKIYSIISEYRLGENTYHEVQQYIHQPAPEQEEELPAEIETEAATEVSDTDEELARFPEVDFEALLEINEEVVAWVYIENTNINYPVVQGSDNSQYISTLIDGSYNSAGSIFMDYRNQPDLTDPHTILYGHNMKNKTMFADVCSYRDQAYYDAHPVGMLMTPDHNYQFEIVAAYVASLDDSAWQLEFFSDEEALQWAQDAMARSGFSSNVVPVLGDRFITLSTCSYEYDDARFVLVGVLK